MTLLFWITGIIETKVIRVVNDGGSLLEFFLTAFSAIISAGISAYAACKINKNNSEQQRQLELFKTNLTDSLGKKKYERLVVPNALTLVKNIRMT